MLENHQIFSEQQTNSCTGKTRATNLPLIEDRFLYIGTSGNIHGQNVLASSERTVVIQISKFLFYNFRYSNPTCSLRSMGRFVVQLLLANGQWQLINIIDRNTNYSTTPTELTFLNIDGTKLVHDELNTTLVYMCLVSF